MKMKIYSIIILNLVYSTRIKLKREYTKLMNNNPREVYNYEDSFTNSNSFINNRLNPYNNVTHLENIQTKYKKQNDGNDNMIELLQFLDCDNTSEPSNEKLNKCAPVTLDYDSLNKLLEGKQASNPITDKILEIHGGFKSSSKDFFLNNREECTNIQDESSKEINNNLVSSFLVDNKGHSNFKSNEVNKEEPMWDTLQIYIKDYILTYIPETYQCKYMRRIDVIKESCEIFNKHKLDHKKYYSIFDPIQDEKLVNDLREIILAFDISLKFDQETYNKFLKEFDLKIFYSPNSKKVRCKLIILSDIQASLIFNYEFTTLWKYITDIPELLTLGGCFSTKSSCWDVILILHIINVFLDNVEDKRDFTLFMIAKVFECLYRNRFDIFKFPYFELECNKCRHNLYYFSWEFNGQKRRDLERRKNKGLRCTYTDKRDLKIIILAYLYQTRILVKYCKINSEGIKLIREFIGKVKNSKYCLGCLFNEYLCILSKIKLKSFKL